MTDNEERKLFFSELQKNTKDTYKLTKLGKLKGSCFPITMLWEKSMTRQDAIDIMADALINFKYLNTASADDIEECERDAEVCLTALLKG